MSPRVRTLGSVLSLVTGILAVFIDYSDPLPACRSCAAGTSSLPIPNPLVTPLLIAGVALVLVSFVTFVGIRVSFLAAALLSFAIFAIMAAEWGAYDANYSVASLILSAVAVLVDAVASRPAKALSERDSPLNLPVFG